MKSFEEIGVNFKKYLKYKGLGNNKAAKKLEFSGSQVSNICNGKNFGVDKLYIILNVFNDLNPEWLITGKGNMIKKKTKNTIEEPTETYNSTSHTDMLINLLQKENNEKQKRINDLKSEIANMKKNNEHESDHTYEPDNQKKLKTK